MHTRPGKPSDNAFAESFIGKLRDECLNEHWFLDLAHAQQGIERWRKTYNTERPHSSLNNLALYEFIKEQSMPIRLTQVGVLGYDPTHVRLPPDSVRVSASLP